ncbi:MAG: PAS domain-containing sensor histidine kinase, partial [Cyclobacteriaceae bacterium]|nr:PAS domain-containing sensor histidine kinase [Cyclobacteriaceae bacterium]
FGYEEKELVGKSLDILIPEHLKVKHSQYVNKYMDMPHSRTMGNGVELVAIRRNSDIFPVEVSLSPWKEGNETFVTAVINDITERKNGEDILRRKNIDLEKKNKELDSLLYSISHEIKAPISTMMGLSNIYRYELKNSLASEFVDHMDKAIKRLNDYVHNITTFATNTNPSLFSSDIEFESMISNLYNSSLKNEPVEKAINTLLEIKGDFPFKTDKSRLEVIFEQLISNAIQFHSRDDKECFVKIYVDKTSSLLRVTVEDNGMGIHEHFLDKIFNMYFRGNYTSKGSGLGLYIVKEAVEKLGGNITVESSLFTGTKFAFEIPTMA